MMKKLGLLLAVILVLSFASTFAAAQENKIAINPIGFLIDYISAEFETKLGANYSLQVGADYWGLDLGEGFDLKAFGIGVGARYYPSGEALHGVYVVPSVNLAWAKGEYEGEEATVGVYGAGIAAGYQWVFRSGVTLDLGLGMGMPFHITGTEEGVEVDKKPTTSFKLGIGYAW